MTPPSDAVEYALDGPRATITLDRQDTRNALDIPALEALSAALDAAEADAAVRLIVLAHRGPVFCSGADLRAAAGAPAADQPVARFPDVLQRLWACRKPTLAAVDGKVRAGGIGLLAACDITVASPASDFATSEVRLGLAPFVISVPFLARVHGGAARRWFLTGAVFDGAQAHQDGLIDVLTDDVAGRTAELAAQIALGAPAGLAAAKDLLRDGTDAATLAERYRRLAGASAELFASPEGQEGIAAMRERRPAAWVAGDVENP